MKGIELPINILVIVAVAIIVLLGVIALFYGTWFKSTAPLSLSAAKSQACTAVSGDCTVTTLTIILNPSYTNAAGTTSANLHALCTNEYSIAAGATFDKDCLNRACGMNC